ncbi:hypothetical protein [uncultured Paraglaciecola sp.]|jgi:hypothetical protein|uniref:hypothetical protein n=1 Tax=uncultured Paraglaciecola sp. TaxID=1765024 RepID=UPI0025FBACAB|nr:hypothetical protein [uncultured Paraglaciecola sp.]
MNDELNYLQDANFYQVGLWSMLPSAAGRRNMIGDGTHGIGDACIALSAKC